MDEKASTKDPLKLVSLAERIFVRGFEDRRRDEGAWSAFDDEKQRIDYMHDLGGSEGFYAREADPPPGVGGSTAPRRRPQYPGWPIDTSYGQGGGRGHGLGGAGPRTMPVGSACEEPRLSGPVARTSKSTALGKTSTRLYCTLEGNSPL